MKESTEVPAAQPPAEQCCGDGCTEDALADDLFCARCVAGAVAEWAADDAANELFHILTGDLPVRARIDAGMCAGCGQHACPPGGHIYCVSCASGASCR